jgi:hypothetical protein
VTAIPTRGRGRHVIDKDTSHVQELTEKIGATAAQRDALLHQRLVLAQ